ncbi:hypothetical protein FQN50_004005 [Emmonsiellopsis sp. PD_5]|nr:hypothetical protein FQN50_004005 [Emmonsiellopsis sp. PD_5]
MSSRSSANERSSNGPIQHQSHSQGYEGDHLSWFGSHAHEANSGPPMRHSLRKARNNTTTPDPNSIAGNYPSGNLGNQDTKLEDAYGKEGEHPQEGSNHGNTGETGGMLQKPAPTVAPPDNTTQNRRYLTLVGINSSLRR